jgi:hypothetical protein
MWGKRGKMEDISGTSSRFHPLFPHTTLIASTPDVIDIVSETMDTKSTRI